MAKKKTSVPASTAQPSRFTNAMEAATTGPTGGIRSLPTFNTWDNRGMQTPAKRRERVKNSRFLQEKLPFIGYINTSLAEEALGDGMSVTSLSRDEAFRKAATALFDLWGSSPAIDLRRRFNIYTCQTMLGGTILGDGEIFALKVKDTRPEAAGWKLEDKSKRRLQLQFFTTDQIAQVGKTGPSERWEDGIQLNELDMPMNYRVLQRGPVNSPTAQKFLDRDAAFMLHVFMDNRLNQVRGTPAMYQGEESAMDALDTRNIEKFSNKIRSTFLGAITTPTGATPASMKPAVRAGQKTVDGEQVDNGLRYFEIAGGVFLPVLKQGETINFFSGQQGMTFGEFVATLMCELAYAYKCPPEYLWKLGGLGSAATRMILRKVAKCHNRIRRAVREQFLQGVWEFVIGDAIETGALPPVPDWNQIRCKGGNDLSIDAGRDEKAEQEKLRTFTGTVEMYCDALGLDGEKVRHERLDEIVDNIRYGLARGLPWFLCIDAMQVQAITGLATSLDVDVAELVKRIGEAGEE